MILEKDFNLVYYALKLSWSKDTCHSSVLEEYNRLNKSAGQCAVSSLIINDYFGGKIESGYIEEINTKHYWNLIDNEKIDTTKNQFDKDYNFTNIKFKTREEILSNEDTKRWYEILKSRVDNFINNINLINEKVFNCNHCENLIEKFEGNSIYLGKRTDIILVGEAPANNGWRKSGMLWRDMNGKFLPSAKILEKLLKELNIELLDLTFFEAVKCFPADRKNLKTCSTNCKEIMLDCIELLKPKYILTLGEHPTKILLNNKGKFGDIAGTVNFLKFSDFETKIIPIYHPSPISPKSYIGNVPIFEELKKEISGR